MSYDGARILITGGLGFIGSNLAARLTREGARVTLCDAMIEGYGGNLANVAEIRDRVAINYADVRDETVMGSSSRGRTSCSTSRRRSRT